MYEGRLCELAECICTETQMDIDIYGEAPDKLTYTEQANKRTNCKRLTWYILCVDLLLQIFIFFQFRNFLIFLIYLTRYYIAFSDIIFPSYSLSHLSATQ